MTNLFDMSPFDDNQSPKFNQRNDFRDDACGEKLDWSRGLESLRREIGRSSPMSGPLLTKVIEREIIPRLFLSHCELPKPRSERRQKQDQPPLDSEALTQLVLSEEPVETVMEQMQELLKSGITLQRIYLDLLAPIARRLGEFWEQDRCSFVDMTIALSRLHWVLRELGRRNGELSGGVPEKRRIYLAPSPGDQHTFGLLMIEEFFLHAGWEMACDRTATSTGILDAVASQHIDVVGFSVSCDELFGPLSDLVKQVQTASKNRDIKIMVGGSLFTLQPDYAMKLVGASVVIDGVNAVEAAETLLPRSTRLGLIDSET